MEGFLRGFYTNSKKLERNLNQSWKVFFPLTLTFYLILITWRGTEASSEDNTFNNSSFVREVKEAEEVALHQEVSEFNPSSQMSMEQLIKVVLNLQEEVRKLKKDNDKLMENLNKQEEIESRLMYKERDLNAF